MRILVANRGEIARRIMRTAHRLGHETVAVFADPDACAPHVREATVAVNIGPAALADSYLSMEKILDAAADTQAEAVHPGYGFLSENADFARAVIDAGLIWIGPRPDAIEQMGSKIEARRLAHAAGVPIIPGFDTSQNPADLAAAANNIGFPVLVKAAAGGGGKGIRIAHSPDDFSTALTEASTEAERSFGNGDVIVERYIQQPRHIEVQIIGDRHGRLAELGTRECSVQRRYQKVLEEAPASNLPDETRSGLRASALLLGQSIAYDSAGTVEFIVDDVSGEHFFLEMNTRLQVEHPVTEMVTGVDLVELMIRSAGGEPLSLPTDLAITGHAIECRINAEDPQNNFAPQIGTIHQLSVPEGVRWDAAIEAGEEISPFYDPMIAKLIAYAPTRQQTVQKMKDALDNLVIGGVITNTGLQRWLLDVQDFADGRLTTRFLDENSFTPLTVADEAPFIAAVEWARAQRDRVHTDTALASNPWTALRQFSLTGTEPHHRIGLRALDRPDTDVEEVVIGEAELSRAPVTANVDLHARRVSVNLGGQTFAFAVPSRTQRWAASKAGRAGSGDAIVAPFPAVVAEVHVAPGDAVAGDDLIVVIEAMKMLHSLRSSGAASVDEVRVAVGDQISSNQILVTFAPDSDQKDTP